MNVYVYQFTLNCRLNLALRCFVCENNNNLSVLEKYFCKAIIVKRRHDLKFYIILTKSRRFYTFLSIYIILYTECLEGTEILWTYSTQQEE